MTEACLGGVRARCPMPSTIHVYHHLEADIIITFITRYMYITLIYFNHNVSVITDEL